MGVDETREVTTMCKECGCEDDKSETPPDK